MHIRRAKAVLLVLVPLMLASGCGNNKKTVIQLPPANASIASAGSAVATTGTTTVSTASLPTTTATTTTLGQIGAGTIIIVPIKVGSVRRPLWAANTRGRYCPGPPNTRGPWCRGPANTRGPFCRGPANTRGFRCPGPPTTQGPRCGVQQGMNYPWGYSPADVAQQTTSTVSPI